MKAVRIHFLIIPFVFYLSAQPQTIFPPAGMSHKQLIESISEKKAQHKLEFAFDLHKVLVHKRNDMMWDILRNYPNKSTLIKSLWNIPLMVTLGSIVWQGLINILPWHKKKYKEITSERFIDGIRHANLNEVAQLFMRILNAQAPDPAMIELLKELRARGYLMRIASNIGKQIFIAFKEQLQHSDYNIFDYFEKDAQNLEGKTIDYLQSTAEKPSPQYYKEYLDQYNPDRSTLIIFIDDKLVNIPPAIAQGFVGIHFKNAEQLRDDLVTLGVL